MSCGHRGLSGRGLVAKPINLTESPVLGLDGVDGPRTASMCQGWAVAVQQRGPPISEVTTIGLDLGKRLFQVHGVDAAGAVMLRRQLKRRRVEPFFAKLPRCLVGIGACGTAHHWARRPGQLGYEVHDPGMTVSMMSLRSLLEKSSDAKLLREMVDCRAAADGIGGREPDRGAARRAQHRAHQSLLRLSRSGLGDPSHGSSPSAQGPRNGRAAASPSCVAAAPFRAF